MLATNACSILASDMLLKTLLDVQHELCHQHPTSCLQLQLSGMQEALRRDGARMYVD